MLRLTEQQDKVHAIEVGCSNAYCKVLFEAPRNVNTHMFVWPPFVECGQIAPRSPNRGPLGTPEHCRRRMEDGVHRPRESLVPRQTGP